MEEPLNVPRPHPTRLDPGRADYDAIVQAHEAAYRAGEAGYIDPASGLFVFTARHHLGRGHCCDSGCRHCPYIDQGG